MEGESAPTRYRLNHPCPNILSCPCRHSNRESLPLPQSLERVTEPRMLTVTVAWFSPVNRHHQAYRRAKLEVKPLRNLETTVGVKRLPYQPSNHSVERGTLWHSCYEGKRAVTFMDDGHVVFQVCCRSQAGTLDQSIRYGIAVTIEAEGAIPVYDEVRARLAVLLRARTP